jgi:hypothetical protein
MATVVEGNEAVMVCVQMTTSPEAATLADEVVVTVSTENGTGM